MQLILLLTKNLLVEQRLQEKLQQLDYEVLSSVQIFQHLKEGRPVVINHQIVIFGETITNKEITELLPKFASDKVVCIRKCNKEPSLEEQEQLGAMGVREWISTETPLDQLRECLAEQMEQVQQNQEDQQLSFHQHSVITENKLEIFLKSLTQRERQVFLYLQEVNGRIISREELCEYLWQEELNHSRMSQLSSLIKNIKGKLAVADFSEDLLRTIWGSGYCLTLEFSRECSKKTINQVKRSVRE